MEVSKLPNQKIYSVNVVSSSKDNPQVSENINHETIETVEMQSLSPLRITKSVSNNLMTSVTENTPGPGSYSVCIDSNSPRYTIGKSSKSEAIKQTPGPGDYENKRLSSGPVHMFSKSTREDVREFTSPGPADYSPDRSEHSYSCFLIGKPKDQPKLNTPGPGSYSIDQPHSSSKYSIGTSPRFQSKELSPGPSDYNTDIKRHTPTCTIGNAKRVLLGEKCALHANEPGPSSYSPTPKIHSASAILIGKPINSVSITPGPAQYFSESLTSYPKSAAYSIGSSKRQNIVRNNFPGPSDYNVKVRSSSQKCVFSKSLRNFNYATESIGPNYNPPSTLSRAGGVISPRFRVRQENSPGPGSYNTSPCSSPNKGFTISKAEKYEKVLITPVSPASYNNNYIRSTSPIITFPKSKRQELFKNDTNAEILYVNRPESSSSTTIRGKPKDPKIDPTPGPGAYSMEFKANSPMYSIGKSKRERRTENSPGPGDYTPKSLSKSFSCKFNKSERTSLFTPNKNNFAVDLTPRKSMQGVSNGESPPKLRNNNYKKIRSDMKLKT
ncbi:hypothetical protein SteCoe_29925 [Stentor coeruleus]|uniref:Uncharacterized protein n=1 Tax=Stentor coeruleus TaxID=5963 RepID=A0A1R2B576_9CILI|nr:hypothetical protein SteCoe_29925 [Stentor coeruleus]